MKSVMLFSALFFFYASAYAGAAFAEARDKDDNTSTWTFYVADKISASKAAEEAKKTLRKAGNKNVLSNASSSLDRGFYAVVFAYYENKGEIRFRYGFGFSKTSVEDAEKDAVKNLQKTDKLWVPEKTAYQVKKTAAFPEAEEPAPEKTSPEKK